MPTRVEDGAATAVAERVETALAGIVDAAPDVRPPPQLDLMAQLMYMGNSASNTVSSNQQKSADMAKKAREQRTRAREIEREVFGGMDLNDVIGLRKKFDEIDADGSGTIEDTEMVRARREITVSRTHPTDAVRWSSQ